MMVPSSQSLFDALIYDILHSFIFRVGPRWTRAWVAGIMTQVGAPEVGLPEIFRMRDGMVYSDVMRGYLSCSGEGSEASASRGSQLLPPLFSE